MFLTRQRRERSVGRYYLERLQSDLERNTVGVGAGQSSNEIGDQQRHLYTTYQHHDDHKHYNIDQHPSPASRWRSSGILPAIWRIHSTWCEWKHLLYNKLVHDQVAAAARGSPDNSRLQSQKEAFSLVKIRRCVERASDHIGLDWRKSTNYFWRRWDRECVDS